MLWYRQSFFKQPFHLNNVMQRMQHKDPNKIRLIFENIQPVKFGGKG